MLSTLPDDKLLVALQEDMVTEEVMIDHRVHPRLIGTRGRAIRKIMDDYKVDIRFPNRASDNPDVVMVTGAEEDVLDCKEHLLNLEEEFVSNSRRLSSSSSSYSQAPARPYTSSADSPFSFISSFTLSLPNQTDDDVTLDIYPWRVFDLEDV